MFMEQRNSEMRCSHAEDGRQNVLTKRQIAVKGLHRVESQKIQFLKTQRGSSTAALCQGYDALIKTEK
jgi:hypothetical protein